MSTLGLRAMAKVFVELVCGESTVQTESHRVTFHAAHAPRALPSAANKGAGFQRSLVSGWSRTYTQKGQALHLLRWYAGSANGRKAAPRLSLIARCNQALWSPNW